MTGYPVFTADILKLWLFLAADILGQAAPGMEMTAGGRKDRAGHISCEQDALALTVNNGVGNRYGGQ